ncbi:MAG: hypothetical protein HY660_05945 [Armatimonadetes bacterium]|nr:hypothetical protein [Armatimonadota bacterium]
MASPRRYSDYDRFAWFYIRITELEHEQLRVLRHHLGLLPQMVSTTPRRKERRRAKRTVAA